MSKFKIGDRVLCVKPFCGALLESKTYTITGYGPSCTIDVAGVRGHWHEDRFVSAPPVPIPHIVIAKDHNRLLPNDNPKVHDSFDSAAAEAKRLAKTMGGEFVVFALVAKAVAPKVEVEFTKL